MSAPTRPKRTIRWWHKWIGIWIGVLLFIWVGSGVIMLLPMSSTFKRGAGLTSVDWPKVVISPAQAIAAAGPADSGVIVRTVELRQIRNRPFYAVLFSDRRKAMVDAVTGVPFQVDSALARQLAADAYPADSITAVERLTQRTPAYYGALPAWRVSFAGRSTAFFVSEPTGEVGRNTARDRAQSSLGHNLHVLAFLRAAPGGETTRLGTFFGTGLIALVSILTGYWLALPRRWRGPA